MNTSALALAPDRAVPTAETATTPRRSPRLSGGGGNQAHLRRLTAAPVGLQAKLAIGSVDDPLEHEADAAADQVMRMADPAHALTHAPPTLSRKCAACEKEEDEHPLQREAGGAAPIAAGEAPAVVHDVLRDPGRPLDPATHAFMSDRFGADFGDVRIHTDARAADSAAAVNAHAYTVGRDVVFGAGRYDPAGEAGRRLIAHELAHTIQQSTGSVRRTPCRTAADCAAPTAGDTGAYVDTQVTQQRATTATQAAAAPGSPAAVVRALNGRPATHVRSVMATAGIALLPEVFGFFINSALDQTVGAQTNPCSTFPAPGPAGAPPNKFCVQIPPYVEDKAATVDPLPSPSTPDQRSDLLWITSTCIHEMEHAHFNTGADAHPSSVTPTADCTAETVVRPSPDPAHFQPYKVKFYLSELAAIVTQFPTYYNNHISHPGAEGDQLLATQLSEEWNDPSEGMLGVIRTLQCVCACDSVSNLVTQAVRQAMTGWTPAQSDYFLTAMTVHPEWPAALSRI